MSDNQRTAAPYRAPGYVSGLRPVAENSVNPKDGLGDLKVPLGVVPATAEVFTAIGMGNGAGKYGPYNYRVAKVLALVYIEALERHVKALKDGQDYDTKTGIHHGCFILANAAIYMDALACGKLIDNRPVKGKAGEILEIFAMEPTDPARSPEDVRALFEGLFSEAAVEARAAEIQAADAECLRKELMREGSEQ